MKLDNEAMERVAHLLSTNASKEEMTTALQQILEQSEAERAERGKTRWIEVRGGLPLQTRRAIEPQLEGGSFAPGSLSAEPIRQLLREEMKMLMALDRERR